LVASLRDADLVGVFVSTEPHIPTACVRYDFILNLLFKVPSLIDYHFYYK